MPPNTPGMINGQLLAPIKDQATFINTARGALVAENEMIVGLQQRTGLLAILDVTNPEAPLEGSPL